MCDADGSITILLIFRSLEQGCCLRLCVWIQVGCVCSHSGGVGGSLLHLPAQHHMCRSNPRHLLNLIPTLLTATTHQLPRRTRCDGLAELPPLNYIHLREKSTLFVSDRTHNLFSVSSRSLPLCRFQSVRTHSRMHSERIALCT